MSRRIFVGRRARNDWEKFKYSIKHYSGYLVSKMTIFSEWILTNYRHNELSLKRWFIDVVINGSLWFFVIITLSRLGPFSPHPLVLLAYGVGVFLFQDVIRMIKNG